MNIDNIVEVDVVIEGRYITTSPKNYVPSSLLGPPDKIKMKVIELNINEDVEYMTDVATFTIPIKDVIMNVNGMFFKLNDKVFAVQKESKLAIYVSYAKDAKRQVFRGYLTKMKYVPNADHIEIECENNMRYLKTGKKFKNSFAETTSLYAKNISNGFTERGIKDDLYNGKKFTIEQLMYWIFREYEGDTDESKRVFWASVPFTHVYVPESFLLGKLIIYDNLHPSVILDKLNDVESFYFKSYVRNENWTGRIIDGDHIVPETNLYVGFKHWYYKNVIDVLDVLKKKALQKEFPLKTKEGYFKVHKFADPYDEKYNPIIENNFEYNIGEKEKLVVCVTRTDNNGDVLGTYYFPPDSPETKTLQALQQADTKMADDKKLMAEKEAQAPDTLLLRDIKDNLINIKLAGIDEKTAIDIGTYRYENFRDNGYGGSFTTFGHPYVSKGDVVELKLNLIGNDEFDYVSFIVDAVTRKVDENGFYTQEIRIGNKFDVVKKTNEISNTLK